MSDACTHDLAEREGGVANGLCPYCLIQDLDALREERAELQATLTWVTQERDEKQRLLDSMTGIADWLAIRDRALQAERERDEAVAWIRVIGEEAVLAGAMSGDRDATLANIRALRRDLAAARQDAEIYRNAINAVLCHEHTTIAIRHAIGAAIDAARKGDKP